MPRGPDHSSAGTPALEMLSQVVRSLEWGQVASFLQDDQVGASDVSLRLAMPVNTAQSIVTRRHHESGTPNAAEFRTLIDAGGLKPQLGVEDILAHLVSHRQSDLHNVVACPSPAAEQQGQQLSL